MSHMNQEDVSKRREKEDGTRGYLRDRKKKHEVLFAKFPLPFLFLFCFVSLNIEHVIACRSLSYLVTRRPSLRLDSLTSSLGTTLASLLRPWEVSNRDDEEAVAGVGNTGQGIVPGQESSEKGKEAACLDDASGGRAISANKVANTEQEESHVQGEEEREESHGRAEGADQQDEGEDEPALWMSVWVIRNDGIGTKNIPSRRDRKSCRTWRGCHCRQLQARSQFRIRQGSRR